MTAPDDRTAHWDRVYETKRPDEVSWYQATPSLSLEIIRRLAPPPAPRILDVGAGASVLADALLDAGYVDLTLVDLAATALEVTRRRIGRRTGAPVRYEVADARALPLPDASIDVWHDRAVFHFLTATSDRDAYLAGLQRILRPGGLLVLATFAEDGPLKCSGLEVARYAIADMLTILGPRFALLESHRELHTTPSGATQAFTVGVFRHQLQ